MKKNMGLYGSWRTDTNTEWDKWWTKWRNAHALFNPIYGHHLTWAKNPQLMLQQFEKHDLSVVAIRELADIMSISYDMKSSASANTRTAVRVTRTESGYLTDWNGGEKGPQGNLPNMTPVDTDTKHHQTCRIYKMVCNHAESLSKNGSFFGGFSHEDVHTHHY